MPIDFPILETSRLILREINIRDARFIHFMRSDPTVNQYVDRKATKDVESAKEFIHERKRDYKNGRGLFWSIDDREELTIVGSICLWNLDFKSRQGEIGYDLHPNRQGQGFMFEAVKTVVDFGMIALDLQQIVGITSRQNQPSQKVLEKAGFMRSDNILIESDKKKDLLGYVLKRTDS
jgi:ribosomal-protein-alanine N-acetyltransferase